MGVEEGGRLATVTLLLVQLHTCTHSAQCTVVSVSRAAENQQQQQQSVVSLLFIILLLLVDLVPLPNSIYSSSHC